MNVDNNVNDSTLEWNSSAVNEALRTATDRAENFLYGMNKGETLDIDDPDLKQNEIGDSVGAIAAKEPTVVEISIGQATRNTILAILVPKVPVHLEIVVSLRTDVVNEIKEFVVNAALIEIYIPVTVNVQIVIPFSTSVAEVSTRVFIDSRLVIRNVPEFYSSGTDGPSISIPKYRSEED